MPYVLPPHMHSLPTVTIPTRWDMVTAHEAAVTIITQSCQVTLGSLMMLHIPWGKQMCVTCVHIMSHGGDPALSTLCAPRIHPSLLQALATPDLVLSPQFCPFQDVTELESHSMWPSQRGVFHLVTCM